MAQSFMAKSPGFKTSLWAFSPPFRPPTHDHRCDGHKTRMKLK